MPIRIYYGQPIVGGEIQDRSYRFLVEVNGSTDHIETGDGYSCRVTHDLSRYWPWCAKWPITEAEYNYMLAKAGWAKQFAPERPQANPHKAVDFNAIKPIF